MRKMAILLFLGITCTASLVYATQGFNGQMPEVCEDILSRYNDCAAVAGEQGLKQIASEASRERAEFLRVARQKSGEDLIAYCQESVIKARLVQNKLDAALAAKGKP